MQAVILCAGRGTRMGTLTDTTPKPMLEVAGKTLLERKFDILPANIDEVILIVGYMGSKIHEHFGGVYKDKKILYVEQEHLDGTAGALWLAKDILKDRFLVLMSDDLYSKDDAIRCEAMQDWSLVVQESSDMKSGGAVIVDGNNKITDIAEGEHQGAGLMCTNMFVLDTRLFEHPMVPKAVGSEEFGLPQTVLAASRASNIPFTAIPATFWFQISAPEDLESAAKILQKNGMQ